MSNNKKPIDIAEQAIVRQARLLDKEIQPDRDLWPEIAAKLESQTASLTHNQPKAVPQNSWLPMSLAASVLISIGALGYAGFIKNEMTQQSRTFAEQVIQVEESPVLLIERPYILARAKYITQIATADEQMSPEVRKVLKTNLAIIDAATAEIRKALNENPNDPFLMDALLLTHRKELLLLNQVTKKGQGSI